MMLLYFFVSLDFNLNGIILWSTDMIYWFKYEQDFINLFILTLISVLLSFEGIFWCIMFKFEQKNMIKEGWGGYKIPWISNLKR